MGKVVSVSMGGSVCFFRVGFFIAAALTFAGCGDITGESPKIVSKEKEAAEARKAEAAARATPSPSPGSRWNDVADSVFATSPSQAATEGTAASSTATAVAQSTPAGPAP